MSHSPATTRLSATTRLVIIGGCFVVAFLYLTRTSRAEEVPPRQSLANLPLVIDGWTGRRDPDLTKEIVTVLGVDDYTLRTYSRAGSLPVGLYIGYHASQRQGDTIHSPLNCLPGAGWLPIEQSRIVLTAPAKPGGEEVPLEINRVMIAKGLDRQLVYYWYQSHRRVVASEYWGKIYTVLDSVRYNRTDAAMVRVVVPVPDQESAAASDETEAAFVKALFPLLGDYLPI